MIDSIQAGSVKDDTVINELNSIYRSVRTICDTIGTHADLRVEPAHGRLRIHRASDTSPRGSSGHDSEPFMLKVTEVIEQNISQPGFCIDTIVQKMFMSRSSLYGKFRRFAGQSLGSYIGDYRLMRAKEMLTTTEMSIKEISDALGFSTQRYFSSFFRKRTGIPPSRFRDYSDSSNLI